MRKGATQLQNIQLLKWCVEQGITVAWNFLFGFPGEDETEMPRLGRDVEAIHHLMPPGGARPLRLDRYSPYYVSPEEWGLAPIRPGAAYRHVYPFSEESVRRIAYFFETEVFTNKAKTHAFQQLDQICEEWKDAHESSHLLAVPRRQSLLILDTRRCAVRRLHRLRGLRRRVYEAIDRNHTEKKVVSMFPDESAEEIRGVLKSLVAARLALEVDGHYLALATYAQPSYRRYTVFPGGEVLQPKLTLWQRVVRKIKSPATLPLTVRNAYRKARNAIIRASVHGMVRLRKLDPAEQAARIS